MLAQSTRLPAGIRSRHFFERNVYRRLVEEGIKEETARDLTVKLMNAVMQSKETKDSNDSLFLKQPVLFGKPEADYFVQLISECAENNEDPGKALKERMKEHKQNFRALLKAAGGEDLSSGIEGALFGRFVTSDVLARTDASVHVAHALTVHPLENEVDYFTVVDDLKDPGEHAGAAHAGDMELGAGVYYGYVVVDVPLLVSNLSGCARDEWKKQTESIQDAKDLLRALVRAVTTVSPGAKLGATAPYARSSFVMLEAGEAQPRTLANAYLDAVPRKGHVVDTAIERLSEELESLDRMYECEEKRFVATTRDISAISEAKIGSLKESVEAALETIPGAE